MMNLKTLLLIFFLSSDIFAGSAVVFMYHRFGEVKYPSTNITMKQFNSQLDYLEENNYNVLPLSEIIKSIRDKQTLPAKTVAITIDDAYISMFEKAYPILKSKKFPFTVFVSTNAVDNKSKFYTSWQQMREMKKNGAEFANHSLSHDYLLPKKDEEKELWKKRVSKEIRGAQKRLHEELGSDTNENPRLFSYPFGEYDVDTIELLKELGYVGITQTSGTIGLNSDLMIINRFPMAEAFANKEGFVTKLNTLPMPIESTSPLQALVRENNPPKLYIKLKQPLKNMTCYISSGEMIKTKKISDTEFEVQANYKLKAPREKYTCTSPAEGGNWYWHSHLWIIKK